MDRIRAPYSGVINIIRFNRHFYLWGLLAVSLLLLLSRFIYPLGCQFLALLTGIGILSSLVVSCYIYDLSGLYRLNWLNKITLPDPASILNIHAGFDETSALLRLRYPEAALQVFDFYDPKKHTEYSISKARKAYPPYPGTVQVSTGNLPVPPQKTDVIFLLFAAHEIRNTTERIAFFKELNRIMKPGGRIIMLEHQRDLANFIAFNFGFFHFLAPATWATTIREAGLRISHTDRFTPFIKIYHISKYHGAAH